MKGCELIGEWLRSILNHFYWCVASTPSGDPDVIEAKWCSLENHVHNVHRHHGAIFPACEHDPIPRSNRRKKWFKRRECYGLI